jgi:hypothetical protein
MLPISDLKEIGFEGYDDDVRDASKFFIVYETGDNTTVAEGEATPLDLFYSRGTNWGDDYDLVEYYNAGTGETTLGFDWLEHDREDLSGEAANTANNSGTFYYAIWNQWQEDEHENVSDSDAIFRRLMYLDDDIQDYMPVASILYVSTAQADYDDPDIVLVGTGRDLDKMGNDNVLGDGIENVRWWSDIEGHECQERRWQFPPTGLTPGWHSFSFGVQDNEGNWSSPQTVQIWIGPRYNIYMPSIFK